MLSRLVTGLVEKKIWVLCRCDSLLYWHNAKHPSLTVFNTVFQVLTPMFDRVESVIVYLISDFPSLLTFRQIHLQHTIIMAVHRGPLWSILQLALDCCTTKFLSSKFLTVYLCYNRKYFQTCQSHINRSMIG